MRSRHDQAFWQTGLKQQFVAFITGLRLTHLFSFGSGLLSTLSPKHNVVLGGLVEQIGYGIEVVPHRRRGGSSKLGNASVRNSTWALPAQDGCGRYHKRGSRNLRFDRFGRL